MSYCIRKEMDMWPYFCHNPTSMFEGGLYFYTTRQEIHVILHAYLADMLSMIVLVQKNYLYLYSYLKMTSINQHYYVLTCTVQQHSFYFNCYCVQYT